MKISIQGEPGSFSHEAATKMVADAEIVPCTLSADVFAALVEGAVEAAVIPIENSLAGSVLEHFDLLLAHDVTVVRETLVRIRHNLIACPGVSMDKIDRVSSHPVARYYGAEILESGIEDNPENYTRFFLVHRTPEAKIDPESNKISLAFSVENRPGSLVAALTELSAIGTNLSKIESRPVHGKPWEYIFYVDAQIHSSEEGSRAIEALKAHCSMVKELGRYKEALQ